MIKVVVIDDVESIRKKNIDLINVHCPNLTVVGESGTVSESVQLIKTVEPDIVFLDIELPDGSGFDILKEFQPINFQVVFVTGHNDYAIRAFKFSALDYLLKPLNSEELIEAVKRSKNAVVDKSLSEKLDLLLSNLKQPERQRMILKTADKIFSVNIQDIVNCVSDKNYTTFYFNDGRKIVVSTTLKEYENMLKPFNFFRTHQSHLINMNHLDYYMKADGGNTIVMKNNEKIPLSVRKKEAFLTILGNTDML